MDRLDRFSLWAIVILIISSSAVIAGHVGEAKQDRPAQRREAAVEYPEKDQATDGRVRLIRNLMESDSLGKAETMARELNQQYPYDGEMHMIMGDIFMRRQDPVRAVLEYQEAVDLNPDYLDRKTPFFQGKKLKTAAAEALVEIGKRVKLNPGDEQAKHEKKTIYYLQRRIAGSCS